MFQYLLSRRTLLRASAAAAAWAASSTISSSQEEEKILNIGSHGGILEDVLRESVYNPFTAETGIEIRTSPYPNLAKVQAMVQTNTVDIDLWEADGKEMLILARRGLLEPINFSLLPPNIKEDLIPGAVHDFGLGDIIWGSGMVYNREKFKDSHPRTWAEFWDVAKFPGPRSLPDAAYQMGPLEAALLADGVTPDKLYPLDVDRAFASLDRIKPQVVKFWATSAEGLNLITSGNSVLGMITFGRLITMKHRGEDPGIDIEFNQGIAKFSYLCMPKGAKHVRNAHRFMQFYFEPKNHAAFINAYPAYGYTNKRAEEFIKPETLKKIITEPERFKNIVMFNDQWWAEEDSSGKSNYEKVLERWQTWVSQ
jgi:putative spermidine/putrescine transport system substrate-binding protein